MKEVSAEYRSGELLDARPVGYKQTEVGIIPEDWAVVPANNVVKSNMPICYGVVQVGRDTNGGVPIVAIKYVKEISVASLHKTAPHLEQPYMRSRVKGGDVLISIKGTIGRVGIVPEGFVGNISRELARLSPNERYSAEYIAHQLESVETQARISRAVVGTTRLEFSIAELRQFELPIPYSLAEQTAIASALSDVDTLITSLETLITKKRAIKTAAMQQLLTGKKRLPPFDKSHTGYKQTELGEIPEDWEVVELGSISTIKTGSKNNQDKVLGGAYPFYVRSQNVERIDSYSYDCEAILVPGEGNIGEIYHYINGKFNAHQRVYVIRWFAEEVSAQYVFYFMKERFGKHAMENSVKATVDSLRLPTFVGFKVIKPATIDEQNAISAVLSEMDDELDALANSLTKNKHLKQGMMQELLTGKTRLI